MTDADYHLVRALNKKRFLDTVTFDQVLEGENAFYRQARLRKGKLGATHKKVEYYWSEHEGMMHEPAPHRYPILRTSILRRQDQAW